MAQSETHIDTSLKSLSDDLPTELYKFLKKRVRFKGGLQVFGSISLSSSSALVTTFLCNYIQDNEPGNGDRELDCEHEGKEPASENYHTGVESLQGNAETMEVTAQEHTHENQQSSAAQENPLFPEETVPPGDSEEIYHISEDVKLGLDDTGLAVELISWFVQYIEVLQNSKAYGFDGHLNFYTEGVNNKFDFHREFSDSTSEVNTTIMSSAQLCEKVTVNNQVEVASKNHQVAAPVVDSCTQTEAEHFHAPLQPVRTESTMAVPPKKERQSAEAEVCSPSRPIRKARQQHKYISSDRGLETESPKVADAGDKTRACRPKKRPIDDKKDDDEDDERKSDEDQLKSPTKRGRRKGPSIATMKENDSVAAKAVKMKTIIVEPTTRTMRTRSCRNGGATSDARDRDKKRATKSSSVVCDNDRNTRGRDWFKKGANRMSSVVCDNEDCSDSPNNEISVGKDICDKSATLNAGKCTRSHSKSATNNIIVEKGTSLDSSVSEGKARNCDRIPTKTFQDSPVSRGKERNRERNPTKTVSKLCVTCKVCDKVCLKKTVWRHLQVHAALGELPPPGEGTSLLADLNPLDVMCNLCYKVFQKTSMPKHARMHRLQGDVSKERSQRRNNAQIRDGPDQGMTEPGKNNQENDMAEKIQKTQIETECLTSTDPGLKTEGLEKSIGANVVLDSNAASSNGVDDTAKESSTYLVSHTLETMTQPHVQEPKEKTKSSTINLGLRDNRDLTMEGKLDINGKMTKTKSKKHESSLTCKICGEICEEDEIWRHLGVHKVRKELPTEKDAILVDGIHPGRAMCDICFEILSRSQLQRHRQQHIKQNEEISQAGGTGNEIEGYDDLQEFAKKDKDGKEKCVSLPYCEICTRQIKGSWNRHQVLHHEAELSVLGLPPEAYIMKCHMCDMKFPDIILLRHHQTQRGHQVQPTRLLRSLPKKSKSKSTNHDASDLNESSTGSSVDLGDTKPPSQEVTYGRENTAEGVEITTKQEGEISDNGMVRKIPLPQDLAEKVSALLEEEPNPTYAEYSKLYAAARKGNGKEPPRENKMQQRCMVCGKVFKSAHNARKHVSDHHFKIKRFECLVCGLEMSTRGKVNIHLLRHTGEKPYACTSCDAEFQYKYLLNRHLEDVHNGPPVRNLERLRRAKKQVESVCEICGAVLSSAYSLQSHIKNKHKEAKYVDCDICGLKLKEASLKDHKIQIHERRIAHICDLCGKGFRYRESYTYHMNTHKGLKPFKCEECGQKLVSRENYKNHMNRHRGIKPHKCDLCQMAFYSYAELCNHKKGHTNQRAYKCTQCPKAFNRLSGLTAHKAVHAREFKYQCKICGKKFNQSSSCRTHEKRHSGVKPFACCYCNKAFTTKGDCKRHENTIHKGFTDPYMKIQGRQKSTNQMITLPVCAEVDGEVVTDIEETVQVIVDNEQAIGEVLYLMSMQGGAANLVTEEK